MNTGLHESISLANSPCNGVCSTSMAPFDDICQGCGRNVEEIRDWDNAVVSKLFKYTNNIRAMARNIEEKYGERYTKMKNMTLRDIKKLRDPITPDVTSTAPVYIFSAGADKAYEEALNIPGLKI